MAAESLGDPMPALLLAVEALRARDYEDVDHDSKKDDGFATTDLRAFALQLCGLLPGLARGALASDLRFCMHQGGGALSVREWVREKARFFSSS